MKIYTLLFLLFSISYVKAQIPGCTDPLSQNYNPQATINNGSCNYGQSIVLSSSSLILSLAVKESSGLICLNNSLYTHNDNNDTNIYSLNPTTGEILNTIPVSGAINKDWEEIAQDNEYIYIGDFGNNNNGNRTDLKIYRISKSSVLAGNAIAETIAYTYSNQSEFTPAGSNNTDFDCEAMIVSDNAIYLFTKQWVSHKTTVYSLPKVPGNYTAALQGNYDVQGLITGATYMSDKKLIVLSGYSSTVQPFIYLLYDFTGNDFFSGNKRKVLIDNPFHQVEGIATTDGLTYHVTNEQLLQLGIQPKLNTYDLTEYLQIYFESQELAVKKNENNQIVIYPNPASDIIYLSGNFPEKNLKYSIYDNTGRQICNGITNNGNLNINYLHEGSYHLKFDNATTIYKFIKK